LQGFTELNESSSAIEVLGPISTSPVSALPGVGNFVGGDPNAQRSPYFWFEAVVPFKITGAEPLGVS
jgi:hypothetical protein